MLVIEQVVDIAPTSKEVVDTDNDCAIRQQALAQVRVEKAGMRLSMCMEPHSHYLSLSHSIWQPREAGTPRQQKDIRCRPE
jgi:hypothetical protein